MPLVEVVAQFDQGRFGGVFLRVGKRTHFAEGAPIGNVVVGAARVEQAFAARVAVFFHGAVVFVFDFVAGTFGEHEARVKAFQVACGIHAAEGAVVAAGAAAFHGEVIRFVGIDHVARRFGLIGHCAAQGTAAGCERVCAFADGDFGNVFQFVGVAVGVVVAVCAEQFLEAFGRAAFRLCQTVNGDGDAVFVHAADGEAVAAAAPPFHNGHRGVVTHHVAHILHHVFVHHSTGGAAFAQFLRRLARADDFNVF